MSECRESRNTPEEAPQDPVSCCPGPAAPCAGEAVEDRGCLEDSKSRPFVEGWIETPAGRVPRVATRLSRSDRMGALRVRWNLGRMRYTVAPGLYGVGSPDPDSPILVTANYKLTFDRLRQALTGLAAWILVLDTKGINVWCAAGGGLFTTREVVRRIEAAHLPRIVASRTLLVPQLAAPGVAAHEVKKRSGFRVVYGPVRAEDLPQFLRDGMQASAAMRRVRFDLRDRLAVVPVEIVHWARYALWICLALFLLAGLSGRGYDGAQAVKGGAAATLFVLLASCGGAVLTPILLPWLPGRAFAGKGGLVGLVLAVGALLCGWLSFASRTSALQAAAWLLLIPALASFLGMNFTGASTYTSLSGVRKEMRVAVPVQASAAAVGLALWIAALFV